MSYTRLYQWIFGDRVPQGPFSGMRYIRACVGSAMWPKLLGTYEQELYPYVEELVRWAPDVIVNAGAAEGYYAVGLARRCPQARIAAYEMSPEGRKLLNLLAARNGIDGQLQLGEELTPELLDGQLRAAKRPAIVLDVEGAELELLNVGRCPDLARTWVLLENHEVAGTSTLPEMRRRFAATHQIVEIPIAPRTLADLPPGLRRMAALGRQQAMLNLLEEGRGGSPPWLALKPR